MTAPPPAAQAGPAPPPAPPTWRQRLHRELDPAARKHEGLSRLNRILVAAILAASVLAVLETESTLLTRYGTLFSILEVLFGGLFALEYLARLVAAPARAPNGSAWRQRLGFIVSPAGLADLAAVVASFTPLVGPSALLLRWFRLARILRLAKLGRMSRALDHMVEAVASRAEELILSLVLGLALMVIAASALYLVEGPVQPEKFGSIPRALWWSVSTLTTIGYGDIYPITPLGKLLASLTAIFSIGLIAMPTGILAAAFSDAVQRQRDERRAATSQTP